MACDGLAQVLGYCLAHPWCKCDPAGLYQRYSTTAGQDTLYIHDMVVAPKARGRGIAEQFLRQVEQHASALQAEQLESLGRRTRCGALLGSPWLYAQPHQQKSA